VRCGLDAGSCGAPEIEAKKLFLPRILKATEREISSDLFFFLEHTD
jgi:hypothetical protein